MTAASKLGRITLFVLAAVGASNLLVGEAFDAAYLVPLRSGIASAAAAVLGSFGLDARTEAAVIYLPDGAVEIVNSCTGLDVFVILSAAMLVFPASLRARAVGVGLAAVVVFASNFTRVLVLCALVGSDADVFDAIHSYAWPVLMIAACLAVALFWMQNIAPPREPSAPA